MCWLLSYVLHVTYMYGAELALVLIHVVERLYKCCCSLDRYRLDKVIRFLCCYHHHDQLYGADVCVHVVVSINK